MNASQLAQYAKDSSVAAAYMSMKCDNRSPYPYAVSVGAGSRMLPYGLQYDAAGGGGGDGDAFSWRGNVDNEYAYVDELLPPPPPLRQSPPHDYTPTTTHDYTPTTTNNNNPYARQSLPDHVTGCLLACRQYDVAPDDRLRVDVCNN